MLQVKNIVKKYGEGENMVTALNGVDITFRENEFVSILGHSGCGKTTLLNIIGGLDHYTTGDLIINGVSTKNYKDRDWDAYRNHSIGFIFQSYNLIPHQSVLANVELALTISGVSKSERRKRAIEALKKVGLENQIHKRPNQMSGGQMQRVAIARALINNPDILLADEPTGALDSDTSIQVMELLKEIAKDKLVIMVTHNPELAEEYSTRIVKIRDGKLISDSMPYEPEENDVPVQAKKERVSMSFPTAVSLSLNNLLTKKGRTILTAFAGSIGIIGIALILSLSTGINDYINGIQEETLSSYPITVMRETADAGSMMTAIMENQKASSEREKNGVYANTDVYEMFNALNTSAKQTNNMKDFKVFLENDEVIQENISAIAYSYDVGLTIFTEDPDGDVVKCDLGEIMGAVMNLDEAATAQASAASEQMLSMMELQLWEEFIPGENGELISDIVYDKYELVHGSWPQAKDEVVVILSSNNELPDIVLYAMGVKDASYLPTVMEAAMKGEVIDDYGDTEWTYDEFMAKPFKLILPSEYYAKNETGTGYVNLTETDAGLDYLYKSEDIGMKLKITGFVRPSEDNAMSQGTTYLGYTAALTEYMIECADANSIVADQRADESFDVLQGLPFKPDDYEEPSDSEKAARVKEHIETLGTAEKAEMFRFIMEQAPQTEVEAASEQYLAQYTREQLEQMIIETYASQMGVEAESVMSYIAQMDDETLNGYVREAMEEQYRQQYAQGVQAQLAQMPDEQLAMQLDAGMLTDEQYVPAFEKYIPDEFSSSSMKDNLKRLGCADFSDPSQIRIYAKTFEQKDEISAAIADYNDAASEEDFIHYTDYVALLMSSITDIISGISYLLIAFVAISLVVSSIMIGIITYISVLERTREIGILRAIGASKHDVSTVFNAETLLVGLTSGLIGVGVSALAIFPINAIVYHLTEIEGLKAVFPAQAAVILVLISMTLTLIAGVIPSRVAAKKDPVEALRTE
ncbi:MAG: ABC transporter ATP-binding protein/permease [Oscillospiraceae bacterium]|nr:ABC transporter ATP-binding protein/permease [Oscillospiraceae bacterium]